jgi:hypothetical protein
MRTKRMLATVAAATVAVVAVTGGSAASAATGSQSAGKGSVAVAANAKPGPDKGDQDTLLRKIAASLHVSLAKLENALRDMKMTSLRLGTDPTDPRVVAVFAKDLHIGDAQALKILKEIVGQPGPVKPPSGKTPPGKTPPGKSPSPAPSGKP